MNEIFEDDREDTPRQAPRSATPADPGGLAGWVLGLIRRREARKTARHLRIVETLPLGGRRTLTLVFCDGERFLVGGGADTVATIVPMGRSHIRDWRHDVSDDS